MTEFELFTAALADENKITEDKAVEISQWLHDEGVLDLAIIKETYEGVSE